MLSFLIALRYSLIESRRKPGNKVLASSLSKESKSSIETFKLLTETVDEMAKLKNSGKIPSIIMY